MTAHRAILAELKQRLRRHEVPVRSVAMLPTGLRVFLVDGHEYDLPLSATEQTVQHLRRDLEKLLRALVGHHRRRVVLVPRLDDAHREDADLLGEATERAQWWDAQPFPEHKRTT